mmetsp:Transcript_106624/g.340201  ORF Transcript_106624/g.340201 Transcript_106624/m.340201 type:complete len:747 (+) Transcript_106624:175-2415(+)
MAIVASRNTIFIKHLSPAVSERVLRQTFQQCDEIEQVQFRAFPGRSVEYYAQIDFKSSRGVIEGHRMSGTPILGVACQVSIMDPGSADLLRRVHDVQKAQAGPQEDLRAPSMAEPQGVQLEYMRRYKEQMEAKRMKTVHCAGLAQDDDEEGLRHLCKQFGEVVAIRVDKDGDGKPFALIEFKEYVPARTATSRLGFKVDGKTLVFTESKTLVNAHNYVEQGVHFQRPVFDQQTTQAVFNCHLNPKLAKAKQAAAELFKKPGKQGGAADAEGAPIAAPEKEKEKPFEWAGRSEKDLFRELVELGRPRPSRDSERARRRSASRERSRRRRRKSEEGKDRRGRRAGSTSGARGKKGSERKRRRQAIEEGQEQTSDAVDVDGEDLDLAVIPNTELLVLGESSSYSSEPSPACEAADDKVLDLDGDAGPSPPLGSEAAGKLDPEASEEVADLIVGQDVEQAKASILDVDEKEQWLAPVDVDEEGSCDEIVVARDDDDDDDAAVATGAAAPADNDGRAAEPPRSPEQAAVELPRAEDDDDHEATTASSAAVGVVASAGGGSVVASILPGLGAAGRNLGLRPSAARVAPQPSPSPEASPSAGSDKWECKSCGEVNKNTRDKCNNCGGDTPWLTVKSPNGEDVDELSSASSSPGTPSSGGSVADSAPKSVADVADSPVRDVAESPPRSIAASGSPRSIAESDRRPDVANLAEVESDADDDVVDLGEAEEEVTLEAERVRGEVADARARIFHAAQ